jgi:hypothetical protein
MSADQGGLLQATVGESFYNVDVTPGEMWQAVGKMLQHARVDRNWRPIDVERAGGPSYKTVQAIEAGDIGTVESLDKCAGALDLSIVDILQSVLASTITPLSPEAAQVVRKFTQTTVAGRTALLSMAHALELDATLREIPPIPAAAAVPLRPRPPRPARPAAKRRTAR